MSRIWTTLALGAMAVGAVAQNQSVYNPTRSIKDQSISVRGWGSGTISETDELAYEGVYSIRVSTRNFFQGGILMLSSPVDLKAAYANKDNLLRFTIRVADLNTTLSGGGGGRPAGGGGRPGGGSGGDGGKGGGGLEPFAGDPFGGEPFGGQAAVGAGEGGSNSGGGNSAAAGAPTFKTMRVIVTTTDGKKSEAYVAVNTAMAGDRKWISVATPLKTISGFDKTNMVVKELAFSGDAVTTFYIGDIRVVNDSTPITGEIGNSDMNLALGDTATFTARGFGGASILKYSWDFDASDGIQVDAEGQSIKRKFRKPGTYVITLTISDANGLKAPVTKTVKVKVNP